MRGTSEVLLMLCFLIQVCSVGEKLSMLKNYNMCTLCIVINTFEKTNI